MVSIRSYLGSLQGWLGGASVDLWQSRNSAYGPGERTTEVVRKSFRLPAAGEKGREIYRVT